MQEEKQISQSGDCPGPCWVRRQKNLSSKTSHKPVVCAGGKAASFSRGIPLCELKPVTTPGITQRGQKNYSNFRFIFRGKKKEKKIKQRWWQKDLGILTPVFRGHLITALLKLKYLPKLTFDLAEGVIWVDLSERGWNDLAWNCRALVKCGSSELQPRAGQFVQLCAFGGRAGPGGGKYSRGQSVHPIR